MEHDLTQPFQTRQEYTEYLKSIPDYGLLADGEKRIWITPGFDFRRGPDRNYGQRTPSLIFAERRGNFLLDTEFFTGWHLDGTAAVMERADGKLEDIGSMCTGFFYHVKHKKDCPHPDYAHHRKNCGLLGGNCWGWAGSAMYGDTLMQVMKTRGSQGIWDLFDKEFKEWTNKNGI